MTIAVWAIAAIGVAVKLLQAPGGSQRLTTLLYIGFGWIGLVAAGPFLSALSAPVPLLIVAGGVVYTSGTIVFSLEKLRYQRAIWHGFVVAGAAIHFWAISAMLASRA
jgi:hemolysin III